MRTVGTRDSNTLAIAPTATISNICGVTQSIEPTYQNLFVKSNMSVDFTVVNASLVRDLRERNLWDEVMGSDLKYFDDALGLIDRVPIDLKQLYATSFEIEPTWLIQAAARRQKWIDQAQSLNLYIAQPSGRKLDALYREAWRSGLKTTYYLRSQSATHVEKSTLNGTDGKLNAVPLDAPSVKACAINDPGCEACALDEVKRIVAQLRARWPEVRIVLRGDSGFCREELMAWCEAAEVDFPFGLARNSRLQKIIGKQMHEAKQMHAETGKAARIFTQFQHKTKKSWARERRVVAKAEYQDKGENPRFVVTSLGTGQWAARALYEHFYCQRGEMENRIKEQMCLFAYRLSPEEMKGNQLRLYLSALAYTLVEGLRRLALKGTEWAEAQVDTLRLKLFKIGSLVRISARRVWLELSSTYPWKQIYEKAFDALRC